MATAGQPLKRTVLEQLLPVVSNDSGDPVAAGTLKEFIDANIPVESDREQRRRRDRVLEFRQLFLEWVQRVCRAKNLPEEVAAVAGGEVYIMGSYKLNVHEPAADIDLCCVVPMHVQREDFFATLYETLRTHPRVKDLSAAPNAHVPIMSFSLDGVEFDALFAQLPLPSVKAGMDIDDDAVLRGVDAKTYLSLNGPRTTNMISKLIPASAQASFLVVLRVVRVWAKRRGLYANKMGYLGGVNFNILVAMICQMYPRANPALMLHRFFLVLGDRWRWPTPVRLCKNFDAGLGFTVWEPGASTRRELMPIITPAYPAGNSAYNVSTQTLAIMKEEFARGKQVLDRVMARSPPSGWEELLAPSDFFIRYNRYLAVDMWARTQEGEAAWFGLVESRLRLLVDILDREPREVPGMGQIFKTIHLFPRAFPPCAARPETEAPEDCPQFRQCFYIGLAFDRAEMERRRVAPEIYLGEFVRKWRFAVETPPRGAVLPGGPRATLRPKGCDMLVSEVRWRDLPPDVFESLGGAEAAKARRKAERAAQGKGRAAAGGAGGKKRGRGEAAAAVEKEKGQEQEEGAEEKEEEEGFTPLHTAAYGDDMAAAAALLQESEGGEAEEGEGGGPGMLLRRLEALDAKGRTPAQLAAEKGHEALAAFLKERALALGGGGGTGEEEGEGEKGTKKKKGKGDGEGDGAFHQPPVDGAAEYDDADDDVLGAAEAAMERAMEEEGGEGGEGEGGEGGPAARRAREAAEQEAKKKALLARHAVLAGGAGAGEVELCLRRVPRWRRGAVVKVEEEGEGEGEEERQRRRQRRRLIRGAVVMDLT